MLSALSDARLIKEAILGGACDYIVKPFELTELLGTLRTAVSGADARREAAGSLGQALLCGLLGENGGMREVKQLVLRYAPSDSPVLVQGESGTGKELVARSIHEASRRRQAPCVAINCGALPETLLETELFGSEKGAFTDAVSRAGCFERANGGTLFLDEIGDMSLAAQARLLRVIEQKELTRVGGSRGVQLDVRVVSATHRDLRLEAAQGRFRADLFYRLGVLPIRVPPLRERSDDIPVLAAHFLALLGKPNAAITDDAREALRGMPGRETSASFEASWNARSSAPVTDPSGSSTSCSIERARPRYSTERTNMPSTRTRFSPCGVVVTSTGRPTMMTRELMAMTPGTGFRGGRAGKVVKNSGPRKST